MSENFYYYLIYPENNYDNKCLFFLLLLHLFLLGNVFFLFSGNIYYLFCLELPNTNHFVRKTTLVNNTSTCPAQRHSALSITHKDWVISRDSNTIKSGIHSIIFFKTDGRTFLLIMGDSYTKKCQHILFEFLYKFPRGCWARNVHILKMSTLKENSFRPT